MLTVVDIFNLDLATDISSLFKLSNRAKSQLIDLFKENLDFRINADVGTEAEEAYLKIKWV